MLKKIIRILSLVLGGVIGYQIVALFPTQEVVNVGAPIYKSLNFYGVLGGAVIGIVVIPIIVDGLIQLVLKVERQLQKIPFADIFAGVLGAIVGLIIGILLNYAFPLSNIFKLGSLIQVLINLVLAYLGLTIMLRKRDDLAALFQKVPGQTGKTRRDKKGDLSYKILDTSVIIDGRIADICKTGFIEGVLVIPEFVLEELRHIADSPDLLKRNRGRRGLDILNQIQKQLDTQVEIVESRFDDNDEVDSKLVKLAKKIDAKIITNDFNLNKVAELQGVSVLNINELSNAVKPIVLPGEEMEVRVIKEGKEYGQGVAYLDDGTMIVVDHGKKHIGEEIEVMVTSILQTAAGRMIFAKPKGMEQVL